MTARTISAESLKDWLQSYRGGDTRAQTHTETRGLLGLLTSRRLGVPLLYGGKGAARGRLGGKQKRSAPKTRLTRFAVPFTCGALLRRVACGRAPNHLTTYTARGRLPPVRHGRHPQTFLHAPNRRARSNWRRWFDADANHATARSDTKKNLYASNREARRNFSTTWREQGSDPVKFRARDLEARRELRTN